jgi:antiphage defense system Thoeris ThsB-like protein
MARRVFFSFHHARDVWRASQVRNSWVTKDREDAGFWDAAAWEEVKRKGDAAVHKWIDDQLVGTSVTAVLIGAQTSQRDHVKYEISESHKRGNGMLGIYIHNIKDSSGSVDYKGNNPFDSFTFKDSQGSIMTYPTYDWVNDSGRDNLGSWVEAAAKRAGR